MRSSIPETQWGPEVDRNSVEEDARLQAQLASREVEWMDAVSYWSDYLTIIDVQGLDVPDLRYAG